MKNLFLIIVIIFSLGIISCSNSTNEKKSEQTEATALYQCPMDCEKGKTHDKPGQCSVCGMDLEKVESVR